eukprot:13998370-Alexandrium_andersonii.AAC.1
MPLRSARALARARREGYRPTRRASPLARLKVSALWGAPGHADGPASAGVPPGLPAGGRPAGPQPAAAPPWARRRPARRRDAPRSGGEGARPGASRDSWSSPTCSAQPRGPQD